MSKKANPTVIGVFTLGAIALIVAAVAIFGSGDVFARRPRAVAFFQGSLQGLSVGAPVNLRGVQVGTVKDIRLDLDLETMEPTIPVYMELEPERLHTTHAADVDLTHQRPLQVAIQNGLHARLASQSLVTGQLLVELDLNPNEPRHFVGADPSTIEIPTSQSDVEKLKNTLMQLPLDKVANASLRLIEDTDRLVKSPDAEKLLQSLVALSGNASAFIASVQENLSPFWGDLHETMSSSRETLAAARNTLTDTRTALTTTNRVMATNIPEVLKAANSALQKAEKVLVDADSLVATNSAQRADFDQTLQNLAATTRSLRVFADELQRRPNSVIVGK